MTEIALKIQRRRYSGTAAREAQVHAQARAGAPACREIVALHEVFTFEGHTCLVFEKHGRSLAEVIDRRALSLRRTRSVTRQMLLALARLNACGLTHTDVKAGNILYDVRSGEARLADLGNARTRLRTGSRLGSREYVPPEVLLGAPLAPNLDVWSLGCCVYEMLTGRLLFDPRRAAGKKYREFTPGKHGAEIPLSAATLADEAEEEAEQYAPGSIVAGKYRLRRELGRGRFATVWTAQPLTSEPLPSALAANADRNGSDANPHEQKWRDARGANDILDLALNYEQVIQIARLSGPFSAAQLASARYRAGSFDENGDIRFRPRIRCLAIGERLRRASSLRPTARQAATEFLTLLLTPDPTARPDACQLLLHPWVGGAA